MTTLDVPEGQKAFADWLKNLRQQAGLNQVDVAAAAGLSERQVIRWENQGRKDFLTFLLYLETVGVTLIPRPPVGQRINAAADRIEAVTQLLEGVASQLGGYRAESQRPPAKA